MTCTMSCTNPLSSCSSLYIQLRKHTLPPFCRTTNWDSSNGPLVPCSRSCCPTAKELTFFFFFLGPHLQHMEVPMLGVKLQLQLPAYTRATPMPDLSCIHDLHHSSWQHQWGHWVRPLEPATSWFLVGLVFHCTATGTPLTFFYQIFCPTNLAHFPGFSWPQWLHSSLNSMELEIPFPIAFGNSENEAGKGRASGRTQAKIRKEPGFCPWASLLDATTREAW